MTNGEFLLMFSLGADRYHPMGNLQTMDDLLLSFIGA
jgi:hypothetical protein